ncbi:MAG: undecaprenyl-diphosphate phosphatase [Gemmatimonadetes bacterium]|nr:undecaprenyl-diphosphate phosphatase [Gemmatimonadota bacterium]NNF13631.1 undecaprenyl-diphosphate phosphatase [Gemmatimonadota bacterium]
MSLLESLLLGFVQGASEFLPVSSSGHLVMTQVVLGIEVPGVLFEVAVHLATLLSILLVYRTRVSELLVGAASGDAEAWRYIGLVVVATIPAGLLGVLVQSRIEALFEAPLVAGIALLITGAILWSSRIPVDEADAPRPGWGAAFLIGVAQAFALVPGISRSGATVVAALWLGIEAREAAAFSFLMAVPAMAGAAVLQIPEVQATGTSGLGIGVIIWGSAMAGVVGVLAIRTFNAMLSRRSFHLFAPYCWVVGGAYLAYLMLR